MGCLLWVQFLIDILPHFLQWCVQYQTILDYSIKAFDCMYLHLNTLRARQNGRHFADDMFKCIFVNENVWIPIKISLKFVPQGPINNIPALVQIMAWRRPSNKSLFGTMMVRLPTHICVTWPQWVKSFHLMKPAKVAKLTSYRREKLALSKL